MKFSLGALGFSDKAAAAFKELLAQPHGIILVTGPTGSGKTTTLYASLEKLNTGDRKILTVEDPVEYQLSGIQQIQVHPQIDLTFATALRAVLRNDPDVLMVGEIRDLETAEIAIQFALTGHPVLSTLHTNGAVPAITRLLDMKIDYYLLTAAINGVAGQRLVRQLCPHCKAPDPDGRDIAKRLIKDIPNTASFYKAVGCKTCRNTGYSGRTAILEVLPLTDSVKSVILDQKSESEIELIARQAGMVTMLEDGLFKAACGSTSVAEVLRVARSRE